VIYAYCIDGGKASDIWIAWCKSMDDLKEVSREL